MKQIDNYIFEKLHIGKNLDLNLYDFIFIVSEMTGFDTSSDAIIELCKWAKKFKIKDVNYVSDFNPSRYEKIIKQHSTRILHNGELASVYEDDINSYRDEPASDTYKDVSKDCTVYWAEKVFDFCWSIPSKQINLYIVKNETDR